MPDNGSFMHAAYAVVAVTYLGYTLLLMRRRARVRAALREALPQAAGGEGR